MPKLYAEESLIVCIEAGKTAAQLAIAKTFDVHFRDAALKCALEGNAVASPHVHEDDLPKTSLPKDPKKAGEQVLQFCEEIEAQLPKGGEVDVATLDPAVLMMVLQLASQVMELWKNWRKKSATA